MELYNDMKLLPQGILFDILDKENCYVLTLYSTDEALISFSLLYP